MDLVYKYGATKDELQLGECIVYRNGDASAPWLLAFCFQRTTDGKLETRIIPVNPGGAPGGGPHQHSWGLKWSAHNRWQCRPSIACSEWIPGPDGKPLLSPDGKPQGVSVWHEVVDVTAVPDGEDWAQEGLRSQGRIT